MNIDDRSIVCTAFKAVRPTKILMLLGGVFLFCLPGCTEKPAPTPVGGGAGGAVTQQEQDDKCATVVESIHDVFQLQRLGQTTTIDDGVQRLNDWQQNCAHAQATAVEWPDTIRKLLTDEQRETLQSPRFTAFDGEHLRDCVLFRALARHLAQATEGDAGDLQRVIAVFRHVIRAIELEAAHPQDVPMSAYEVYLLGKGTAADRAWIFAGLLRQLKIDAVLIAPTTDTPQPAGKFLVGVLLEGGTYLFDPQLGVAIPGGEGAKELVPATLADAVGNAELLKRLDADEDHQYPLRAADLEKPGVWLITDSAQWSDRMHALQGQFSGEHSMIVADPLQDTDDGPGLFSRVVKAGAGRWTAEGVKLWGYPDSQLIAHLSLTRDQQRKLAELLLPFGAYSTVRFNELKNVWVLVDREQVADPSAGNYDPGRRSGVRTTVGVQMRARLAQLNGELARAIVGYREVAQRSKNVVQVISPEDVVVRNLHLRAIDDANFWMGACKFEQGEYRVAVDTLERYRAQQPKGAWARQCRYLLALSLAAQEDYEGAIDELAEVESDDPEFLGYVSLIRQWESAAEAAGEKAASENPAPDEPEKPQPAETGT